MDCRKDGAAALAQRPQSNGTGRGCEKTARRRFGVGVRKAPGEVVPCLSMPQAEATSMPLNSPEAMRFCHSAGPVMWALVPPASTATVTGMSTTSNS